MEGSDEAKTVPPVKKADKEQKGEQPPAPVGTLPLNWLAPSAVPAAPNAVSAHDGPASDQERNEIEEEEGVPAND